MKIKFNNYDEAVEYARHFQQCHIMREGNTCYVIVDKVRQKA